MRRAAVQCLPTVAARGSPEIIQLAKVSMNDSHASVRQAAVESLVLLSLPGDQQIISFLKDSQEEQPFEVEMAIDDALEALASLAEESNWITTPPATSNCIAIESEVENTAAVPLFSCMSNNEKAINRITPTLEPVYATAASSPLSPSVSSAEETETETVAAVKPANSMATQLPNTSTAAHATFLEPCVTVQEVTNLTPVEAPLLAPSDCEGSQRLQQQALIKAEDSDSDFDEQCWFHQSRLISRSTTSQAISPTPGPAACSLLAAGPAPSARPQSAPIVRTICLGPKDEASEASARSSLQNVRAEPDRAETSMVDVTDSESSDGWVQL